MRNEIHLFLQDDIYQAVKQESEAQHLSPSEFISMKLKEVLPIHVTEQNETSPDDPGIATVSDNGKVTIRLSGSDAQILKKKAAEAGLSPTAFVRRLVITNECVFIQMPTDDLDEYIERFTDLEKAFMAAIGYIKRGEGEVFKQDIDLLKDYMSDLTELFKTQISISYETRNSVKRSMIKELRDQIRKNRR